MSFQTYLDSYFIMYHGPRRGGKSVSASQQAAMDLLSGRRVFANYPIAIDFDIEDGNGPWHWQSEPLDVDELGFMDDSEIKKKYEQSVIVWDEANLWLFSRDPSNAFNKLMGLAMTLIGKLEMSIYVSLQFLSMIDKNIRLQADAHVMCTDLSFKYRNLERGSTVGQLWQDISGRFTGETFEYSEMVYQQTFHAKDWWHIYNTKQTYDIMAARQKRRYDLGTKVISRGDLTGAGPQSQGDFYTSNEQNGVIIRHLIKELRANDRNRVASGDFWALAKARGFVGDVRTGNEFMATEMGVTRTTNNQFRLDDALVPA